MAMLIQDLNTPLHQRYLRNKNRVIECDRETDLSDGYVIDLNNVTQAKSLAPALNDFQQFMSVCMGIGRKSNGYIIRMIIGSPTECPVNACEAFMVRTGKSICEIAARDAAGFRRALIFVEDEMTLRQAPHLPLGSFPRWTTISDRIARSPCAPYRWKSGWELEDDNDFYPDELLNKYAHCGINGIWVAGLLRNLVPSKVIPELGPARHRLDKLQQLVARAARYGIKIFLFCIEPRSLPVGHPVLKAYPEIKGVSSGLCTSTSLVQAYIRDVMCELFTTVPALGGVINIFNGERHTTCWLHDEFVQACPRCRVRSQTDVLAEDLNCFMAGIRAASPSAKLIAWAYLMDSRNDSMTSLPIDPVLELMKKTHPDIIWMGNFEHGGTRELCGKRIGIHEYSLSYIGPSDQFRKLALAAQPIKRKIYAKLQIGTTYEIGSVPYLPVPGIVYAKCSAIDELNVSGMMVNWTIGGYPGLMQKAAGEAAFHPRPPQRQFLERLAGLDWGMDAAPMVAKAWDHFANGLQSYPCSTAVFYFGPITRSPAYHLHLDRENRTAQPYNFGLDWSRNLQPFEDQVSRWLGPFTAHEVIGLFRAMDTAWSKGLLILRTLSLNHADNVELPKQTAVAAAIRVQLLSVANVIEFYTLRDGLLHSAGEKQRGLLARMRQVAEDDLTLASEMKQYLKIHPAIGFFPEMYAYSYSAKLIDDKIQQVYTMLETLDQWRQTGVELDALTKSVIVVQPCGLDFPDKWGN
ncbi:MAG: hypothetical protein KKD14_06740 [Verrucomicrobia bacterium]|nr:hypothetical protein [Verrucomicrobiota bacterium]